MVAIGFDKFVIRVNNRQVLNGLLESLGVTDKTVGILRALDKLPKIGAEKVQREMTSDVGVSDDQAKKVLELSSLQGSNSEILAQLEQLLSDSEAGQKGAACLTQLFDACAKAGLPEERVELDVSIARGLDYYTGTIYETFLTDERVSSFGSVCSGGRYDNLAGLFTSQPLPGVGASLGLDRLLAAMEELGMVDNASTPAPVLITMLDKNHVADYLSLGRQLRQAGIATEVFPDVKQMGKQMKYANQKGFRVAVIAGSDEFEQSVWQVKDLTAGEQQSVPHDQLAETISGILSAG